MKPISKLHPSLSSQQPKDEPEGLRQLRRCFLLNQRAQEKLKKIRDQINLRLHHLDEFISTYRLRTQYPPASSILSYLKFERSTPQALKEQSRVIEMQEAIRNSNDEDFEFMKKLNQARSTLNRKEINFADLPKDPSLIAFAELAHQCQTYRTGMEVYRAWLQFNRVRTAKRLFTQAEEQLIREKQRIYKDNWEKICQFVEGRSFQEVYYQFHNRINPDLEKGRWTLRQTLMLLILLEHFAIKRQGQIPEDKYQGQIEDKMRVKCWAQIAQKMRVKSELQVRERFCNIIDPSLGRNVWSSEMESLLLDVVKERGYSWKEIAKLPAFTNKTDNSIWRKFRNIMIRRGRDDIIEFMRDCNKKDLIDKILNYKHLVDTKRANADFKNKKKKELESKRQAQLIAQGIIKKQRGAKIEEREPKMEEREEDNDMDDESDMEGERRMMDLMN